MADFSSAGGVSTRAEDFGADLAISAGTVVTGGSANTKGSYTELIASTGIDYNHIEIFVRDSEATDILLDISVGSAGNEVVVASNLYISSTAGSTKRMIITIPIPIHIPVGTRISARCQAGGASDICLVNGVGYSSGLGGQRGRAKVVAYGDDTAASGGTAVDAGGVAHTKGSYVQLTASTNEQLKEIMLIVGLNANTAMSTSGFLVDIAVGAAASEEVLVPNIALYTDSANDSVSQAVFRCPIAIPAGTRIAVRMQSTTTASPDDILDMVVYGVV